MTSRAQVRSPLPTTRCSGNGQGGFALVLVLWVLAGLTVVAVAAANSARIGSESTRLLRDRVRAEAEFISASARIAVIASSSPTLNNRYAGARGTLYADGRATAIGPDQLVVIQDARGLISLNRLDAPTLARLLELCGAGSAAATSAVAALTDYTDADDLKLLNGAEAFEYRMDSTLPPPRNAPLLSSDELWRVLGWPGLRGGWTANRCGEAVTVHGDGRFNQATAPLAVLRARGIDDSIARALVAARAEGVALDPTRFVDNLPSGFASLGAGSIGPVLRVRHLARFVDWQLEYVLELTPTRPGGPWRLHEIRYSDRPAWPAAPEAFPALPAVDHRPTDQESRQFDAPSRLPFGN